MKVIEGFKKIPDLSLALGFFDGVHKAHREVLSKAAEFGHQNNTKSAVIIFKRHPDTILNGSRKKSIITFEDKLLILSRLGIDYAFLINFDKNLSMVEPEDYIKNYLVEYFSPIAITTGYSHTFGKDAKGTPELLRKYSKIFDYEYFEIPPVLTRKGKEINSSLIKKAVKNSNFELVKDLTGYDFYVKGQVIHGNELGRKIGYPTANFIWPKSIIKPQQGVFVVKVHWDKRVFDGILNIGLKSFGDNPAVCTAEVFIPGFSGNLYGKTLTVKFLSRLRDEMKFENVEMLKAQIEADVKAVFDV